MQAPAARSEWWRAAKAGFKKSFTEHLLGVFGVPVLISFVAMWIAGLIDDLMSGLVVGGISVGLAFVVHGIYQLAVAPYRCERARADDNYRRYRDADSERTAFKYQLAEIARREAAANGEAAQRVRALDKAKRYWYDVETALTKAWHVEKRVDTEWGKLLKERFERFAVDYFTEPAALRVQRMIREFGDSTQYLGHYKYADALTKAAAQLRTALEYEDLAQPDSEYGIDWMQL